jgi:serine/threonine protein kinase
MQVHERIGEGGNGIICRATHPTWGKVALKYSKSKDDSDGVCVSMIREISIMKDLGNDRPGIMQLLDVVEYNGSFAMILPLAKGSLNKVYCPLHPREILRQLAVGLQNLHRAGYHHRDLKLSNVMVMNDHEVRIGDLGSAKNGGQSSDMTTYIIRAPELVQQEAMGNIRYTKAMDVWSLGVLFAELYLYRKTMFKTHHNMEKHFKQPFWDQYLDTYPEEARVILKGLLHLDPQQRWTLNKLLQFLASPVSQAHKNHGQQEQKEKQG